MYLNKTSLCKFGENLYKMSTNNQNQTNNKQNLFHITIIIFFKMGTDMNQKTWRKIAL